MCRLFETIRVDNGVTQHLWWHRQRMEQARRAFWPESPERRLEFMIQVPPDFSAGVVRCNVIYGKEVEAVTFSRYEKRVIRTLKLVYDDSVEYPFKFRDRTHLERLLSLREGCDEIIIVKNGLVTDSSIANLIFFDGKQWFTPARPLLNGTCRQRLIATGKITAREIKVTDLDGYSGCRLINAMRGDVLNGEWISEIVK